MSNKLPHTIEHFAAIKIRSMCSYAMIYEIRLLREKKTKSTYSTLPFLSDRQLLIENFWQPKEEIANAGCSEQDRLHHLQGPVRNKNMGSLFKMSYGLQDNDSRASNQGESSLEHGALCDFPDHRPTQPAHLRQKTD